MLNYSHWADYFWGLATKARPSRTKRFEGAHVVKDCGLEPCWKVKFGLHCQSLLCRAGVRTVDLPNDTWSDLYFALFSRAPCGVAGTSRDETAPACKSCRKYNVTFEYVWIRRTELRVGTSGHPKTKKKRKNSLRARTHPDPLHCLGFSHHCRSLEGFEANGMSTCAQIQHLLNTF